MITRRDLLIGAAFLTAIVVLAGAARIVDHTAEAQDRRGLQAPRFEVDPMWPRPLPNNWVLGQVIGLGIDAQDHVWIVHRNDSLSAMEAAADQQPPTGSCCSKAPPVLEFDSAGNLVGKWGGPADGYEWPTSNHGIFIDYKNNVWIGGNGEKDAHVLKFTRDGKFLMQIGRQGKRVGSNDLENFGRVAKIFVDPKTQRGLHRRRLPEQARRRHRCRHREVQALLGRLRQQARRHRSRPLRSQGAAGAAVPHAGALRRPVERRIAVRVRPPERSPPGLQGRRHVRQGNLYRPQHARRRLNVGRRVLEGSAAEVSATSRMARTRRSTSSIARPCRS